MTMKTRVALYPVFADTLPVARYLSNYCKDIEIVELLSPPGSCACGKDASFLDNRDDFGRYIKLFTETDATQWDELYLLNHDVLGVSDKEKMQDIYSPMIRIAEQHNRKIKEYPHNSNAEYDVGEVSHTQEKDGAKNVIKKHATIQNIKTFLVFIGGVIAEANAFEVLLNLYGELSNYAQIAAFSSSPNAEFCGVLSLYDLLYNRNYSEEQKVSELQYWINLKSREKKADIILLQLDEPLMPFSDTQTSGFGIIPYIVSQVISPDYCICCLPYGYTESSFLEGFKTGMEGRFGFIPDRWHLSNAMLDFTTLTTIRDAGGIHIPMDEIRNTIPRIRNQGINIGSDVLPQYSHETVNHILQSFAEYREIASIL